MLLVGYTTLDPWILVAGVAGHRPWHATCIEI
jgi:hypothetical protein